MIHVLTVHWELDDWVDIQLRYLALNISEPYRVYAYLNRLKQDHADKFFYSSDEDIEAHAVKLNLLADHVVSIADSPNDILIFLDGDAFPVGDVISYGREKLPDHKLIAVQRLENFGDIQPHPCFCMTTVGFWQQISGDWLAGYAWKIGNGETRTDVGGNLLKKLQDANIDWYPMLRSNRVDLHPVFFGLYDDVVYHHGAGFRKPITQIDVIRARKELANRKSTGLQRFRSKEKKFKKIRREIARDNRKLVSEIFHDVQHDQNFYRRFMQENPD